jgi:hypothetical protein
LEGDTLKLNLWVAVRVVGMAVVEWVGLKEAWVDLKEAWITNLSQCPQTIYLHFISNLQEQGTTLIILHRSEV